MIACVIGIHLSYDSKGIGGIMTANRCEYKRSKYRVNRIGSVPFSMTRGYGILSVEAPDGSHRCPCERRQPIEEDIRPVQAVWRKGWPGSQHLFLSPRMAQIHRILARLFGRYVGVAARI